MRNSVKKSLILVMSLLLVFTFSIPVYAEGANTTSGSILLDDKAGLLTSSEAPDVLASLEKASSDSNCNIAIATTADGYNESGIQNYSANYYATTLQGKSETNFAVVLTVDISSRKVDVATYNPGSPQNLNQSEMDSIRESITSDLTDGNYAKAFKKFADNAAKKAKRVNPDGTLNKSGFPWGWRILISLVIGFIIALIICMIIKKQLKTVEMKAGAADYIRPNSLNITNSRDNFLYSNVTKTAKPKNDSSGGGSRSSGGHSTGSF